MPVETQEQLQKLVDTAEESIQAAVELAKTDARRPRYHFRAPAQWMDDPNGIIYHEGYYHIMYSLNPNSSAQRAGMVYKTAVRVWDPNSPDWTGGITVWGHARSKDLVKWEHLPIALYPSIDKGEHFIWFGCTVINGEGNPMAIYTAIGPEMRPEDTAQQWAHVGDKDLIKWKPIPQNPLIVDTIHGDDNIREWRDPFIFKEAGRTFMVLGAQQVKGKGSVPVVCLYEALDPAYTKWTYRGVVFEMDASKAPSAECPNLVKLGDKWLLLVSPHRAVEYFVGQFDLATYKFTAESTGLVDRSTNYYATNLLFDDKGRCLMWGAIVGFSGTVGWNGCVSLPRSIAINARGELVQQPVEELKALRGAETRNQGSVKRGETLDVGSVKDSGALEILANVQHGDGTFEIRVAAASETLSIRSSAEEINFGERAYAAPRSVPSSELHIFVDNTVFEVYVDKKVCHTVILPLLTGSAKVSLAVAEGEVTAEVALWELNADDLFH